MKVYNPELCDQETRKHCIRIGEKRNHDWEFYQQINKENTYLTICRYVIKAGAKFLFTLVRCSGVILCLPNNLSLWENGYYITVPPEKCLAMDAILGRCNM